MSVPIFDDWSKTDVDAYSVPLPADIADVHYVSDYKAYRAALKAYGESIVAKAVNGPGSNPPGNPPNPPPRP